MPTVNLDLVLFHNDQEREIAERIIVTRKNVPMLRASKPALNDDTGKLASYVWRMTAFFISPKRQHGCMPVTADFDLPDKYWARTAFDSDTIRAAAEARRAKTEELDDLVERIVDAHKLEMLAPNTGFSRWAKVLV